MLIAERNADQKWSNKWNSWRIWRERCYTIGRKLNLVADQYYEEALEIAVIKDSETQKAIKSGTTANLGLFHGIPVSIKDHVFSLQFIHNYRLIRKIGL